MAPEQSAGKDSGVLLFICHASGDNAVGDRLQALFMNSLGLKSTEIRYTTAPDSALKPEESIHTQLARDCTAAVAFVALISERFLVSPYPMFELGARWGSQRTLIPLRLRGLPGSRLPAPISDRESFDAGKEKSLEAALATLAKCLGRSQRPPTDVELSAVARLNRGRHRLRTPSSSAFAIVMGVLSSLLLLVALGLWNQRESFRDPAHKCRDGLDRLLGVRNQLTQDTSGLPGQILTDTNGCVDFLSMLVGDDE